MSSSAATTQNAETIGRFRILKALGRGAQGEVYLAHDPQLDRHVAIKSLKVDARSADRAQQLLEEARTMSKLAHPNIVKVLDAIPHAGNLYLVLEYIEGSTVGALLRDQGRFDKFEAVGIAIQILDGLAYAHSKNIIHCDIKPANVMLDKQGVAHLMDFGIATVTGSVRSGPTGTPRYMAPEYLDNHAAGAAGDVFSLSLVLYEMLTGKPAIDGKNAFEVMHRIANLPIQAPSTLCHDIDERLDDIVMKGLLKNANDRYHGAAEMQKALSDYHMPKPPASALPDAGSKERTLEFLLLRIQHKSNFPALSQSISTINRIAASDDESIQALSSALLKDFSLTNKLLRMVNSPAYTQFGGKISTISRAVMILGFEAVRNLAITLILFEHMQNKAQAGELKEEVVMTLFSGLMAQNIVKMTRASNAEEGFICGAFHRLGRILAMYYLYDESVEIGNRVQQGAAEEDAACAVLGISYEDLGIGVARVWHLPDLIVSSMARIRGSIVKKDPDGKSQMLVATNLADELCRMAATTAPRDRERKLEELRKRYAGSVQLNVKEYAALVDQSVGEFMKESALLVTDSRKSRVDKAIRDWSKTSDETEKAQTVADTIRDPLEDVFSETAALAAAEDSPETERSAESTLTAGIQDITNTLVEDYNLNDILRIILETMYRGMGFNHVLLCTRDLGTNSMRARFGFGADTDKLLKTFAFPLKASPDVFQLVIEKNVDLFIADTNADNIRARIPEWHRHNVRAETFMLLPITIEGKGIGLFYADCAKAGQLQIQPRHLNLLKTLRNQAVLAIRQKR